MDDKQIERARKGGVARREARTPEMRKVIARRAALIRHRRIAPAERSEAARQAAPARWGKAGGL